MTSDQGWTVDKDKLLYQLQTDIFIARVVLYDSALHYNWYAHLVGWPPAILTGISTILKSVEFTNYNSIYITIVSYILVILSGLMSSTHMLVNFSGKTQMCKESSDNLFEILEDVKLIQKTSYDKRPIADTYLTNLSGKLITYQKKTELIPASVFHKYYPSDIKDLQFSFLAYNNPPIPIMDTSKK